MSGRGQLFTYGAPGERLGAALAGVYSSGPGAGLDGGPGGGFEIRDRIDKLVCRVGVLAEPGGSVWLRLEPLRGYERDGERIRSRLLEGGFRAEVDWTDPRVRMSLGERSDAVVARVLGRLLEIQDANLPGALAASDAEFLHDYRVALRRARSVQREMRTVFAPADFERFRGSLRWLQEVTGPPRDLDVFLQDLGPLRELAPQAVRGDLDPFVPLLEECLRLARGAMTDALTSERARVLRAGWGELLQTLVEQPEAERPGAARAVEQLASERILRVHRSMVRLGQSITGATPPETYHALRKKGKELRYLLELFAAPLFEPAVVTALVPSLKVLQDVLGRHQDRDVQVHLLTELGHELVSRPGGARALMAVGLLIERLQADAQASRDSFTAAFSVFASEAQCKLVERAFR